MLNTRALTRRLSAHAPAELLRLLWKHARTITPSPEVDLRIGMASGAVFSGLILDCSEASSGLHLEDPERGSVFLDLHAVQWVSMGSLPKELLIAVSNEAISALDFEPHLNQVELKKLASKVASDHQSQSNAALEIKLDARLDLTQTEQRRAVQGTLLWLERLLLEWRRDPQSLALISNSLAGFQLGEGDYAYQERTVFVPVTARLPTFDELKERVEALL